MGTGTRRCSISRSTRASATRGGCTPASRAARAGVLGAACAIAPDAGAHAFGARYDLPLPLELYLGGAAAAVALSFVVTAFFVRGASGALAGARVRLDRCAPGRWLAHPAVLGALRALSLALFLLVLGTGFFGVQAPLENLAPTLVWVIGWVGLAYVSALVGNLWALINPWSVAFALAERVYARGTGSGSLALRRPYPRRLGRWPAVALFWIFAWFELVSSSAEQPARLATLIAVYSVLTWTGMFVFGREVWLRRGEAFSVAFGLLARFAPLAVRAAGARDPRRPACWLRPYAAGLLTRRPVSFSMMAFVLLMLATVTLDGFLETAAWSGFLEWVGSEPALRAPLLALRARGYDLLAVLESAALLVFPLLFLGLYLLFSRLVTRAGGGRPDTLTVARFLVLSLVPIAIAYHLAHYLSFLLLAGQLIIPLASDPFGFGWDLFGSANYRIDVSVVDARFAWYAAVVAIVLGHVIAVFLAHVMALRVFGEVRAAVRSQLPMIVLMVGYTMASLWILSQPIVEYTGGS